MTHVMDADREFYGVRGDLPLRDEALPRCRQLAPPGLLLRVGTWFPGLPRLAEREGVPKKHKEKALLISGAWRDVILAPWIEAQRGREKKGNLTSPERVRLESLPGWSWQPKTAAQP